MTLTKWSVNDYHCMIQAGILKDRPVELLAGEICQMTPEGPSHTFYGGSLADIFRNCLGNRGLVREARPITLTDSEPEPDIAIVRGAWADYRHRHPGARDIFLVVEIFESSLAKDLQHKRAIYAAAGIEEYWILDLTKRRLIVLLDPEAGDYRSQQTLAEGIVAPIAFPDLKVSLNQLF